MDRNQLREDLRTRVDAVADRVSEQASGSRQDMARMERLIYEQLDRAKADLLQVWVDQARDDSTRPTCPHCQQKMRQKEQAAKTSVCVGGDVKVKGTRWYCNACKRSFFPAG